MYSQYHSNRIGAFFIRKNAELSYFLAKTYVGYSLEVPQQGTSNEYRQHMFSSRNKKILYGYPLLSVAMSIHCIELLISLLCSQNVPLFE